MNLIGLAFLGLIGIILILRITCGECEGYKTIVRKPKKAIRMRRYISFIIGLTTFLIGTSLFYHYFSYEREMALESGKNLITRNENQLLLLKN